MSDLGAAFGLMLVLEGLLYAAFPQGMKEALETILNADEATLRKFGFASAVAGLIIVYMARG